MLVCLIFTISCSYILLVCQSYKSLQNTQTVDIQKHLPLFWVAGFAYINMLVLCLYPVTASKCPGLYINNKWNMHHHK